MIQEAYWKTKLLQEFSGSLNEGNLTTDLYKFLKDRGVEQDVINSILASLKDNSVEKEIESIVERVDAKNKNLFKSLKNSTDRMKCKISDKIKFLKIIQSESILNESIVFKTQGTKINLKEIVDITKIPESIIPYIENLVYDLFDLQISKKGEGRTGVGKGEILLAVLGNGSLGTNCGGDICVEENKQQIGAEIKSVNGVISTLGTDLFDKNYSANTIIKLAKKQGVIVTKEQLGKTKFFDEYAKRPEEMYKVLKIMFRDRISSTYPIKKKLEKIFDKVLTFDENANVMKEKFSQFIQDIGVEIFDEYKKLEGWKHLILITKDFIGSYQKGSQAKYSLVGFLSNGSATPQVAIKG